ncbi:MAG: hypothetical protein JNK15_01640 [Planctomycetes bacterium]|nr:hypothetical protein [Planctomycetota bacterium]
MKFLRNLDLYKAIVLVSLVLLPVGYYMVRGLDEKIVACKRTIDDAFKAGGLLEQIGALQRKVEVVLENKKQGGQSLTQPRTYFEGQILASVTGGLKSSDFQPQEPKLENGVMAKGKQPITDFVVDVLWLNKDLSVTLEFVYAALLNCEANTAAGGSSEARQSIWKLRELHITNATDDRLFSSYRTPPAEISDKWSIKTMKYARREPRLAKDKS